jgi:uncharacterized phage-like protein YoqJ
MHVVCGTGHRPQDLPCKFKRDDPWKLEKLVSLRKYLEENPPDVVISGMAIGWDQWLCHTALQVGIPVWAYVPFEGQESRWSDEHKSQFHKLLGECAKVNYVSDSGYAAWKMHRRNEAMLKDSERVFALWNPEKKFGGTYSTVATALSMQKPIINFWSKIPSEVVHPQ